jgi:hypothetical protein
VARSGICEFRKGLHDDGGRVDVLLDGLVGQDRAAVYVDLVANGHVVAQYRHVLEARPLADCAVPANNGRLDPCMVLDTAVLEDNASLETHTIADDDVGADGDIGADAAVLANLGGRVDQNIAAIDKGL